MLLAIVQVSRAAASPYACRSRSSYAAVARRKAVAWLRRIIWVRDRLADLADELLHELWAMHQNESARGRAYILGIRKRIYESSTLLYSSAKLSIRLKILFIFAILRNTGRRIAGKYRQKVYTAVGNLCNSRRTGAAKKETKEGKTEKLAAERFECSDRL
jgi:hypothetical protein